LHKGSIWQGVKLSKRNENAGFVDAILLLIAMGYPGHTRPTFTWMADCFAPVGKTGCRVPTNGIVLTE